MIIKTVVLTANGKRRGRPPKEHDGSKKKKKVIYVTAQSQDKVESTTTDTTDLIKEELSKTETTLILPKSEKSVTVSTLESNAPVKLFCPHVFIHLGMIILVP